MSAMDMTLLHYLKNTLKSKYGYMLNLDKSNSKSIELLKTNNEILVKRLNDYLSIYTTCQKNNELLCLSEVINRWNTKAEENENNEIKTVTIVKIENCDVRDKKIRGDINIFDLIFEEFILNATQRANTSESIKLSLDVNVEKEYVTFSIINENSTIPPDQRPVLGKKFISSSTKGGGIGFSIVQFLLKKIGAIENPNDKSLNFNIHYNDNEPISFKFQFLKKLI
ncbi:MAG: hypothetical protein LBG80_18295 [Bacteroidales bacterium]|jgi:signal transduction histidine kinase|nr:hypothetical protein [Bacteroidales bacterium]